MQKDRGFRSLAIVAIVLAVAGLAVGYAALSETLTIGSTTTVKGANWSVHFDTATLSEATLKGLAKEVNAATITVTNISVDISLMQPNDSVTYTFDVVNDGTLDAKLSADPTLTGLDDTTSQIVSFALTYADGTAIKANDTLDHGTTRNLKLVVSMKDIEEVQTDDQTLNLSATLLYVQK